MAQEDRSGQFIKSGSSIYINVKEGELLDHLGDNRHEDPIINILILIELNAPLS
jgi:hypothetical protein